MQNTLKIPVSQFQHQISPFFIEFFNTLFFAPIFLIFIGKIHNNFDFLHLLLPIRSIYFHLNFALDFYHSRWTLFFYKLTNNNFLIRSEYLQSKEVILVCWGQFKRITSFYLFPVSSIGIQLWYSLSWYTNGNIHLSGSVLQREFKP